MEHISSILDRVLLDLANKSPENMENYKKYVLPEMQRARQEREEREAAEMQDKHLLEIKITKATLFIYEAELLQMLCKDPELFSLVIHRGKGILRGRASDLRNGPPEGTQRNDEE